MIAKIKMDLLAQESLALQSAGMEKSQATNNAMPGLMKDAVKIAYQVFLITLARKEMNHLLLFALRLQKNWKRLRLKQ